MRELPVEKIIQANPMLLNETLANALVHSQKIINLVRHAEEQFAKAKAEYDDECRLYAIQMNEYQARCHHYALTEHYREGYDPLEAGTYWSICDVCGKRFDH